MNRVTFPPASGDPNGTNGQACPAVSCAAAARARLIPGKGWLRPLAFLLALMAVFGSKGAAAAGRQQLKGHLPAVIQRMKLQPTGELPATNRLNLAVGLPLRNGTDITNFLRQLYDPASPNYRQFITPDQFTARFGPSQEDYDQLKNFFTDRGLAVTAGHPNRIMLDVNLSVADIQRVFHVRILTYEHPSEPRAFYAPDAEPSIDLDVPILHISGLDNYQVPRPLYRKELPGGRSASSGPLMGSGPGGTYFANDFREAYAPGVTLDGTGQSLALMELDGYYLSDITNYETLAGLRLVPLVNVPVDGFANAPTPVGDPEVSLDIEMAVDMAPGLKQILVYEQENGAFPINDILNKIATDNLASQISSSWLLGDDPTTDLIYLQYATQGQSFFQAAGDNGSFNWSATNQQRTDDPYITLVGGTTLTTTNNGAWLSETVWNWNYAGGGGSNDAGGGGISTNYAIPIWQQSINMSSNMGSTNFRNIPDVALTADNIYVIYENGETNLFGGTSCAAPLWACFCALANEKAQLTGSPAMGFINPAIYAIGKGLLYNETFHDITNGNNTNYNNPTEFFAVPGFDLCTGWGTPNGAALINALVPATIKSVFLAVISNTISGGNGNGMIDPNECNNLNVLVTNEGNVPATDVQGTLTSLTPGVIIGTSTASFPNIPAGQSEWNQTQFVISTEPGFICGTTVNLQLVITCDQTAQTNSIQIPTGETGTAVRFDNSTPAPLSPLYGTNSPITVSNFGTVSKVAVSLYLTTPDDGMMDLYLMSPSGATVYLAQVDAPAGTNFGTNCAPDSARTTFDDDATVSITNGAAPFAGTYAPESPLSAFSRISGDGVWRLYAFDLAGGASTLQCWSLFLSPVTCEDGGGQCPGSDLSITMKANPIATSAYNPVTFTMTVSNAGPSPAMDTVVNQTIPSGVIYEGSSSSQGTVFQTGSMLTFFVGTMGVYSNATITVSTEAVSEGLWTSTAVVGATNTNPNPSNNSASASVLVTKPFADLGLTMYAQPVTLPDNGQANFLMTVTNHGPDEALAVTVTNFLPASLSFVSGSASQGSVSPGGTLVSLGTMLPGAGATATLVLSPTVVGTSTLTSTVGLDPSEVDPILTNNTASAYITALPAADLGVSVAVSPSPAISGGNITYVVTVTNAGPSTATNVFMNETLPAFATFVSTSQTNAVDVGGLVTWTIPGAMPSGTSQTLTVIVQAQALIQGVVSNVLVSTFSVAGQPADPNTNNNFVSVSTVVLRPTVIINPLGDTLTWQSFQPPNGAVAPGETVTVAFQLENIGNIPTTNLVATLQTNGGVIPMQTNSGGIPVPGQSSANYGALAPGGGHGSGQLMFSNNAAYGGTIVATLQLQDATNKYGTVSFTFVMPVVSTFWNTNLISIPATNFVATNEAMGPAGPFPSSNLVSGISGFVSDVAVTVSNLEHTYPSDISLWLVGPGGQSAMLMSYAALYSSAAVPVTLTFDQFASAPVPAEGSLYTGSYQPSSYNPPIISTNLTGISPPANTNLAVFEGFAPNGWWFLYAYDSKAGDYGAISNGWSVAVTTITPVNEITDIGVTIAPSANQVILGGDVTYTITVTNLGTNAATVFLTNVLAAGMSFVSNTIPPYAPYLQTNLTSTNQAQIYTNQVQVYNLGLLAGDTNLTLGFVANAVTNTSQSNTFAYIGSSLLDPNTNNNQAAAAVLVVLPAADVAAAISSSAAANTVVVGTNVIYTLAVTNYGPGPAYNVTGLLTQGAAGLVFTNDFGNLASGSAAAVYFTNAPAVTGSLTNLWTVSTVSVDTNLNNSAATNILTVTYPEPILVTNGVLLLSGSSVPLDGAIDPNETVTVAFTLANIGVAPTTNLTATLQSGNGIVPVTATAQNYGTISPGASGTQDFAFTASGGAGSVITAVLSLTNNGASWGTISFPFVVSSFLSFANTALITISDDSPASPYPSTIQVSITNIGIIGKVTAALQGFTHTFPHDVNVLLISPSGQQTVLMAHAGGPYSVTNLVLDFDDASTNSLTVGTLVSGTNHATQIPPLDSFPVIPGQPSNTNLSVFNSGNPNGGWSLCVYDDAIGNGGSIANGWTLNLSLINPVNPAGSLALGMTHTPDPVFTNNFLTFSATVTNLGPFGATNVLLTDTLPANAILTAAAASQGTFNTNSTGVVTFNFGALANPGATATGVVKVQPFQPGSAANSATATDAAGSSASASNTATVTSAALPVVLAAYQGRNLTLTLDGQPGQTYILQVSTNLISWAGIATNVANSAGQFSFTNSITNAPVRFFRALHLPQ
jgi:uncharacterized repeat protein (TIGR01451 family)